MELHLELQLTLADQTDTSPERVARLTDYLIRDIKELPLIVQRVPSPSPPEGARASLGLNWETLAVALATPVAKQLIDVVRVWLTRQKEKVAITIKAGPIQVILEGEASTKQLPEIAKFLEQIAQRQKAIRSKAN